MHGEVFGQGTVRIKYVYEAALRLIESCVSHPHLLVDGLNSIGSEISRDRRVAERFHKVKCAVEHVDSAICPVIGSVEEILNSAAGKGQAGMGSADVPSIDRNRSGVARPTLGFQPLIVPSIVAKMKIALPDLCVTGSVTVKSVLVLADSFATTPVGLPCPPDVADGMVTISLKFRWL